MHPVCLWWSGIAMSFPIYAFTIESKHLDVLSMIAEVSNWTAANPNLPDVYPNLSRWRPMLADMPDLSADSLHLEKL